MNDQQAANRLLVIGSVGLAALAALTIWVGPHAPAKLQDRVSASANEALAAGGFDWAHATALGQDIRIDGVAPSDEAKASAMSAVGGTAGVSKVSADAVDVAPVISPYRLTASKTPLGVTVEGVAPTRQSIASIDEAAQALFGGTLTINLALASGAPRGVTWDVAAIQALDVLDRLDQGDVLFEDVNLRVAGVAANAALAAELRDKLSRPSQGVTISADIRSAEDLARASDEKLAECNEAFGKPAVRRGIVFASQSARLTAQGNRTLEGLVETAKGCNAFIIAIEAHTDGSGRRDANMRLSEQRAEAVKAYFVMRGVAAERMTTKGFGPDRPVASNRTERGRASNRRIEFRVTGGDRGR